jgi:hypothetical protein
MPLAVHVPDVEAAEDGDPGGDEEQDDDGHELSPARRPPGKLGGEDSL